MHYDSYLSVDPGLTGAICILTGSKVEFFDMPTYKKKVGKKNKNILDEDELVVIIDNWTTDETLGVIENVHSSPQMGVTSAFTMGFGLGLLRGLMAMRGLRYQQVTPQTWKKYFGLIGTDKQASIDKAKELYPEADLTLKKHHGRAEALLMAHWLMETNS